MQNIKSVLQKHLNNCREQNFRGFDPYDFLNSPQTSYLKDFPNIGVLFTQLFKYSPVNFRHLLRIKKSRGPKDTALFIISYLNRYKKFNQKSDLALATNLVRYLLDLKLNNSNFWGSAFNFQIKGKFSSFNEPNSISTVFCGLALIEYFKIVKSSYILELIVKTRQEFFDEFLETNNGPFFLYSQERKNVIINSNALILRFLYNSHVCSPMSEFQLNTSEKILDSVILRNKDENGFWPYNLDLDRRFDFDYHQGFIIESLIDIYAINSKKDKILFSYLKNKDIGQAIEKSLNFYFNNLFNSDGSSRWKKEARWPVDIHDLAQGIITTSKAAKLDSKYSNQANKMVFWTMDNMLDSNNFFYYHKWPFLTNKIPYMRWSQAWMALALSEFLIIREN